MIIMAAYREWAKEAAYTVQHQVKNTTPVSVATCKEELSVLLKRHHDDISMIFFVGWSWYVDESIIDTWPCFCIHPSDLPQYRGGSPIQHQIINGVTRSKVTIFRMDHGLDTGPIISQVSYSLSYDSLLDILEDIKLKSTWGITDLIIRYFNTGVIPEGTPQNNKYATTYRRRKPEDSEITPGDMEWLSAKDLSNKIKALQDPYPNAFIVCGDGSKLYITKARTE